MKRFRTMIDSVLVMMLVIAVMSESTVMAVASVVLASISLGMNLSERRNHEGNSNDLQTADGKRRKVRV